MPDEANKIIPNMNEDSKLSTCTNGNIWAKIVDKTTINNIMFGTESIVFSFIKIISIYTNFKLVFGFWINQNSL